MRSRFLLVFILILVFSASFAQRKKRRKKSETPVTELNQPTALNPLPQKNYAPKTSKKVSNETTYEAEQKFYERMAELEKTKRKNEKMLDKPQYSDPMYFGHKRPPKKHKPGKMKYCKECGLRH